MKCFVDTNILLYAKDRKEPLKQMRATAWLETLLRQDVMVLSAQSLREYYHNMLRNDRSPSAVTILRAELQSLTAIVPDQLWVDYIAEAWALQDRFSLSFWDALLIAAAQTAGCGVFLSEDMQAGQSLAGLRIVNPFRESPAAIGL